MAKLIINKFGVKNNCKLFLILKLLGLNWKYVTRERYLK